MTHGTHIKKSVDDKYGSPYYQNAERSNDYA